MIATAVFLALTASSASAAIIHPYQSQITEAGGSALGEPHGLAVDSTGNLYASDASKVALDKFDSTGAPVTAWGTNGQITEANGSAFNNPFGLSVDGSDNVWLTDVGPGLVDKFSPSAALLNQGNGEGNWSGEYIRSIAYSQAAERLFLLDSGTGELWALKPDATVESGLTNFGTCCFFNVAADNSAGSTGGDVYVSGEGNAVFRIHGSGPEAGEPAPFSASGEPGKAYIEGAKLTGGSSGPFGTEGVGLGVKGLAVDSAGNLFVAGSNGVFEFDSTGTFLGRLTGTATGTGGAIVPFGEVTSVGVGAASGKLYVGDSANHVVDVFGPGVVVPDVTTEPATAITTTSATFNGEVHPEGLAVEECFFEYGTTTAYGATIPCESPDAVEIGSGTSLVAVHAHVANLPAGATIHFRLAAANANGTNTEGGDQSFFTGAAIDSTSVSDVSATAARLEAEINPHGKATTYHFEYDTAPYAEGGGPHGTKTPNASAGSGTVGVPVAAQIQGLAPSTTYHYRVVAENELGATTGPDRSFTTQSFLAGLLPDGRVWEMVTPPNKHGAPVQPLTGPEGGLIQAPARCSPASCSFASFVLGPLGPESQGVRSPYNNELLSSRGPGGWSTQDITTPHEQLAMLYVGFPSEYKFFPEDLSSAIVEPVGATPLSPQTTERTPYRREADGTFVPLITEANVPPDTRFGGKELVGTEPGGGLFDGGVEFLTASPDSQHMLFTSPSVLVEGVFQSGFESILPNLYELSSGRFTLVSVLPNGEPASEAGVRSVAAWNQLSMRGAMSADGERIFFETTGADRRLYLRQNATRPQSALDAGGDCTETANACTIEIGLPEESAAGGPGNPVFQAASTDGSRVFFTDASRLTTDSTAAPGEPDLYMCEIVEEAGHPACELTDLSLDVNPGEAANVAGQVSAIDVTGAHVYFAADGVLTHAPNAQGEVAVPGTCISPGDARCNLYVYDTASRQVHLVAGLSSQDEPVWAGGRTNSIVLGNLTARVSPNGRYFTFMSTRSLTGYDNRDARSGEPDAEVYLYDSGTGTGSLACASCNPTGSRPLGVFDRGDPPPRLVVDNQRSWSGHGLAASIPGWDNLGNSAASVALRQPRYLSDSGRLFFNSADALVPSDTNGVMDVYEYEPPDVGTCTTADPTYSPASGGCVDLISSGTSPEESAFLDATEDGSDVFFLTASRLVTKDVDSSFDIYDASIGGGEPRVVNPPECQGDACQQPATPPVDATPGSLTFNGAGNVLRCPKGKVKRHGKCVAKHHRKHHRKKSHRRAAGHTRGGAK